MDGSGFNVTAAVAQVLGDTVAQALTVAVCWLAIVPGAV